MTGVRLRFRSANRTLIDCGHGTLTAGNGPVGNGTKWTSLRDIVESATRAVMMIVISRIESVFNDSDPAGDPERAALTLRTTVLSPPV